MDGGAASGLPRRRGRECLSSKRRVGAGLAGRLCRAAPAAGGRQPAACGHRPGQRRRRGWGGSSLGPGARWVSKRKGRRLGRAAGWEMAVARGGGATPPSTRHALALGLPPRHTLNFIFYNFINIKLNFIIFFKKIKFIKKF